MLRTYLIDQVQYDLHDFNEILNSPILMGRVRSLTLHANSGLNFEIDHLIDQTRLKKRVKAKAIVAYKNDEAIGWLLMTREEAGRYTPSGNTFKASFGVMVQLFVDHEFRKQKIGTNLVKIARKHSGPYKLCVCPWDYKSEKFFSSRSFKTLQNQNIWSHYQIGLL